MPQMLDDMMERASQALARRDYLDVEARCAAALDLARQEGAWAYYARIVLPLQEARRQRRMIAAEGRVRLGTDGLDGAPDAWPEKVQTGCILVTTPHDRGAAAALQARAREQRQYVEVLFAESARGADAWTLRSVAGPVVTATVPAPPEPWRDRWIGPGDQLAQATPPATPADWFLDAMEALGDAALTLVEAPLGEVARVEQIEAMLEAAPDHEILHQRLADAARAVRSA